MFIDNVKVGAIRFRHVYLAWKNQQLNSTPVLTDVSYTLNVNVYTRGQPLHSYNLVQD